MDSIYRLLFLYIEKHNYSGYKHFLEEIKKNITNEEERLFKKMFEDHPV